MDMMSMFSLHIMIKTVVLKKLFLVSIEFAASGVNLPNHLTTTCVYFNTKLWIANICHDLISWIVKFKIYIKQNNNKKSHIEAISLRKHGSFPKKCNKKYQCDFL